MQIPDIPIPKASLLKLLMVVIVFVVGLASAKMLKTFTDNFIQKYRNNGRSSFLPNFIFYFTITLTLITSLDLLNINIKYLLGTAGFLTVALGFASQTSVSNIISGFFLMSERPFVIGDTVKIDQLTGVILSIDLLSTRLRTFDNLLVRIPNETLMKANIVNYTHFPIRRVDIEFKINFQEKIEKLRELLFQLAHNNPMCFDEPRPIFIIKEIGDWAIMVQFSFWVQKDNYVEGKNSYIVDLRNALEKEKIELPLPYANNLKLSNIIPS